MAERGPHPHAGWLGNKGEQEFTLQMTHLSDLDAEWRPGSTMRPQLIKSPPDRARQLVSTSHECGKRHRLCKEELRAVCPGSIKTVRHISTTLPEWALCYFNILLSTTSSQSQFKFTMVFKHLPISRNKIFVYIKHPRN